MMSSPDLGVDLLLRDLAPHVLGAVVRRFRDFAASEDAVQEAMIAAAMQWPRDGIPDNPRGWLIRVAQRRMFDYLRSEASRRSREAAVAEDAPLAVLPATDGDSAIDPDDTLSVAKHKFRVEYDPVELGAVGPPPPDNLSQEVMKESLLARAGLDHRAIQRETRSRDPDAVKRYDPTNNQAGQIELPDEPT